MDATSLSAILGVIFYVIIFFTLVFILRIFKIKTTKSDLGIKGWLTWKDLLVAAIGFILYLIFAVILTTVFQFFPWFEANEAQDVGFNSILGTRDLIITAVSLIIVAPIAEELIFRGLIYGKLRKKLKGKIGTVSAILIVSLLFAIIHGQWNVGVNVFAMSVVMCLQREFTGTIYSGIVLHMVKNAIAFYIIYLMI